MAGRQAGAQQDCIPGRAPWHSFAAWQGKAGGQGSRGAEGFSQIGRQKSSKCHEAKRFPHFPLSFQPQSISAERRCTEGGVGEGGQATCPSAAAPVPRQGKERHAVGWVGAGQGLG